MPYKRSDLQRFRRNQLLGCTIVLLLIVSLLYFTGLFGSDSSDLYNSAFAEVTALANKKQSGPLLIRLAWHDAGTYDKSTNTGGPRGTIRFPAELNHAANAGLSIAISMLEPIKQRYPTISYADFYALAGVAAIRALDGPRVAFHPGRIDDPPELVATEGRLPDGSNSDPQHLRMVFGRMGFNDREIVALSGAHSVGRMHKDRSGFEGQWTSSPQQFNNEYFQLLVTRTWEADDSAKPRTFSDGKGNTMMPSDMALLTDESFRAIVLEFAEDEDEWKAEFSLAFQKLIELGWPKGSLQQRVL